ncbi:hypothetical protein FB466_1849 [Klugiella xanthotipulae]|uniref:Uncharacterized protein n=1 Tax=Klugiella xanthotipulae TaxID=244735 RepID=A0A543HZ14_9MICO|nr:hypothetical protein FB466_1849 [Klugiella xanthotipulae]
MLATATPTPPYSEDGCRIVRKLLHGWVPAALVTLGLFSAWAMVLILQTPLLFAVASEGNGHWLTPTGTSEAIRILLLALVSVILATVGGYLSRKSWPFRLSRRGVIIAFTLLAVMFCAANLVALLATESLLSAASATASATPAGGQGGTGIPSSGLTISAFLLPLTMLAPPLTALVGVAVCIEGKQGRYTAIRTAKLAAKWALSVHFVAGLLLALCFFLRLLTP